MLKFKPEDYGPEFAQLLAVDRSRPLDDGAGERLELPSAANLTVDVAFQHAEVCDQSMAACCLAGVWLLYDQLDQSHRLSQSISTPEGSFWHGILHRREGDYSNAKYWFRQVGGHPIFEQLAHRADELAAAHGAEGVLPSHGWDPAAMVDACQAVVRGRSEHASFCRAVQQAEWEAMFDYCYRRAVA